VPGDWAGRDARRWQDIEAGRDTFTAVGDLTVGNFFVSDARPPQSAEPRTRRAAVGSVVVGDIPQQPPCFQPLAELDWAGQGVSVVRAGWDQAIVHYRHPGE